MKNFTNNFKQFTSRLSARWLIMTLMMLVGSSSAWAQTYLAGDFNSWSSNNDSYKFTYSGDIGTLSISLNAKSTYNFKVVHDGTWYTNPEQGTMTRGNCSNWSITTQGGNDNNTKIMADIQGTYIFKFDKSNNQLTITYPAVTKVFIRGGMNSWTGEECEGTGGVFTYKGSANNNTEFKFVANENNWDGEGLYNGMSIDDTKNTTKLKLTRSNNDNTKIVNTDGVAFEIVIDINTGKYWIQKPSCTGPKATDFKITGVPSEGYYTYNGLEQKPTAEWNNSSNKGGEVTTYISSSSSSYSAATPIDAGTYCVFVTSVADGNFCDLTTKTYIGSYEIKQADQTAPIITVSSTQICGKDASFTVTGGESTGEYSYTLADNTAGVTRNGTTLTATQNGSVTLKVKKLGDTNYNDSDEAVIEFNFTMPIENVTLSKVDDGKTTYCVGDRAEFKLTYSGPYPTSYEWSGSAKGSLEATGKTANVLDNGASWYIDFSEAKTYTISLSLTGCNTDNSDVLSFEVNSIPDAPTDLGSATICKGAKTTLPTVTGSWYADATTITPLDSRDVKPEETTSYFATSKSNNCESSSRTEYVVTVNSLADANNYELTKTTADYTGTAVTLQISDVNVNNNAGAVVSVYFKQDGNIVDPINVGEYDVYVITAATDDICAGDIKIGTFTITCPEVAAPAIDATNTIIQCGSNYTQKGQIAITKKVDGLTYTCNLNGTTDITIPDNGVISEITTAGTYTITATNGCGNNASTEVEISLTDNTVSISAITGSETICSGNSQNYSVTVIEDVKYKWSINPDSEFTLGTNGNNSIEVTAKGDKEASASLSLTVSKNGCETSIQQPKTITLIPLPTITTVDPTSGKACSNTTIADLEAGLTITKSDNSDTKWYFNSQEQDITSTLLQGEYTIKAISKTGECLSTQGIIYTVTEVETSPAVPFIDGKEGVICGSVTEFSLTELSGWDAETGEEQGIKILWYTDSYTPTDDVQTDIKAGTYYARTLNGDCYSDYVALNIGEPKIPNPITLTRDKEFTTPWIPIKVTVGATDGTYTLSYPDNLNTVKNIQITKNGNDYTYLIPRPKAWGTGNDDNQPASYKQVEYTVRATGNQGQCPDMGKITITLKDENNDTCNWKK